MSFIVQLNQNKSFFIDQGLTLLKGAEKAGVTIPYSCRNGRCSSCKCKLIRGRTQAIYDEYGLSVEEKREGWILSCVRTACSDIELTAEDLEGIVLPDALTLPARIHSLEKLAPDVLRVMLRLPPSVEVNFIPGQYIDVIGNGGIRRSYSLACAHAVDKHLELHIRAIVGGAMSQYWFEQARINDLLRLNGPLGTFFVRETQGIDLVFLATGTGYGPVKAMLESLAILPSDQQPNSITVIWGGRAKVDLYLTLPPLPVKHRFVPVLSRAGDDWTGSRGYVQDVFLSMQTDLANAVVYACGSEAMIQGAKSTLTSAGLPVENFHSDAFVCSAFQ